MTDLEQLTTPEEYEAAIYMKNQYEERLLQQQVLFDLKVAALEEARVAALARPKEILDNLKSQLWALKAQCHDYELHMGHAQPQDEEPKGSWTAEVLDLHALIWAAAQEPEKYEQYLAPNQTALNKVARKLKATMYIPGVVATRKEKP